jgi:hypothetical protein
MTKPEQVLVGAMLTAAGYDREQVAWMAPSCTSVQRCREVCREKPSQDAIEIDAAHKLYRATLDLPDDEEGNEARAKAKTYLELVVGRVKTRAA